MGKIELKDLNEMPEIKKKSAELFAPAVRYLKEVGFTQGIFIEFASQVPVVIPIMDQLHEDIAGLINTEMGKKNFTIHYKKKDK